MKKPVPDAYRRNLPHIQPQDGVFFVTFRLYGSIPLTVLKEMNETHEKEKQQLLETGNFKKSQTQLEEAYFEQFDETLDNLVSGPAWLAEPDIAQIVYDAIRYRDGKDYKLVCFCIMSNHVHLIIYKLQKQLHRVMQLLKSYTAVHANKLIREREALLRDSQQALRLPEYEAPASQNAAVLHFPSKFWQPESFDRLVRDRNDLANKIRYTLNNPVKAGLVNHWLEWKYNYCRPEFIDEDW